MRPGLKFSGSDCLSLLPDECPACGGTRVVSEDFEDPRKMKSLDWTLTASAFREFSCSAMVTAFPDKGEIVVRGPLQCHTAVVRAVRGRK